MLIQLISVNINVPSISTAIGTPGSLSSHCSLGLLRFKPSQTDSMKTWTFPSCEGMSGCGTELGDLRHFEGWKALMNLREDSRDFLCLALARYPDFSCEIIEPMELAEVSDWLDIISDLKSWGEVPDPDKLERVTISENNRGPIGILSGEEDWIAEFLHGAQIA